jgi:adenylylsulfate kinase-like enzyme
MKRISTIISASALIGSADFIPNAEVFFGPSVGCGSFDFSHRLNEQEIAQVELLALGALAPLHERTSRHDVFPSGLKFSIPLELEENERGVAKKGACIRLEDRFSNPVATLLVDELESIHAPFAVPETTATVGGRIVDFKGIKYRNHESLVFSAREMRNYLIERGDARVVSLHASNPLTRNQLATVVDHLSTANTTIVVHIIMDSHTSTHVPWEINLEAWKASLNEGALRSYSSRIILALLPSASSDDNQSRMRLGCLIARNFGASDFFINHHPDYHTSSFASELGIRLLEWPDHPENMSLILQRSEPLIEWGFEPVVERILQREYPPLYQRGLAVMLVGLSGSGKTTLAMSLKHRLESTYPSRRVSLIDGDEVRNTMSPDLGHTDADRQQHHRRMRRILTEVVRHRGIVVVSTIAPLRKERELFRTAAVAEGRGNFVLVHVATSLSDCAQRDPKQLYKRALSGEVSTLVGIGRPFEPPEEDEADMVVESKDGQDRIEMITTELLEFIINRGHMIPAARVRNMHASEL